MCMDGVPSTCLAAASSRRRTWCVCTAPTLGLVGQRLFLFKGASGLCFFSLPVACRGFFLCGCPGRSRQEKRLHRAGSRRVTEVATRLLHHPTTAVVRCA